MTNKEKIEEMAKIVDEYFEVYCTTPKDIAESLYEAGYRKIPDGAVVLTKEDLKKYAKDCLIGEIAGLDILKGAFAKAERVAEKVRKETAKEILQKIEGRANWFLESQIQEDHFVEQIKELVEEYGVEIENG